LSYNKVSAPQFQQLASQLQTAVSQFRGDYTTYDGQLSNAIGANCKNKPQDFYTLIVEARSARTKLSDEVTVIASLMSQYRDAMVQYQNSLSGSGGVQ